ncbi:MAG: helix-turn-helix domain-containing protein [Kiritimatiellales bacterium]
MASIGETFKAARIAKGVSESEAGAATKILTKMIVSIEADDFSGIAAPMYARGFIRIYAKYLEIDPDPLLAEYNEKFIHETGGAPEPYDDEEKKYSSLPFDPRIVAGAIAGIIVLIVLIASITNCIRRRAPEKTAAAHQTKNARVLLNEPLPDLYLIDRETIEQK